MTLTRAGGMWHVTFASGGAESAYVLEKDAKLSARTASFLIRNLRPYRPTAGTVVDASGSDTPTTWNCRAPGTGGASFVTSRIAPTLPATAITIDVTPTDGSAQVTLFGPRDEMLDTSTVAVGETGGVGYWNAGATAGTYRYAVAAIRPSKSSSVRCNDRSSPATAAARWIGRIAY